MNDDERQARLAEIRAAHWEIVGEGTPSYCCECYLKWPCDYAYLLAELDAATARAERVEAERNSFAAAHDTARRVAVVNVGTYRGGVNRWRCRVCGREDFTSFSVPHADDCVVGAMERAYSAALAEGA